MFLKSKVICNAGRSSEAGSGLSFILIWAEAGDGELQMSPSLLLAYLLLASRRPNALFLRMATGFGFAQIGDYVSSLFFLFRWAPLAIHSTLLQVSVQGYLVMASS